MRAPTLLLLAGPWPAPGPTRAAEAHPPRRRGRLRTRSRPRRRRAPAAGRRGLRRERSRRRPAPRRPRRLVCAAPRRPGDRPAGGAAASAAPGRRGAGHLGARPRARPLGGTGLAGRGGAGRAPGRGAPRRPLYELEGRADAAAADASWLAAHHSSTRALRVGERPVLAIAPAPDRAGLTALNARLEALPVQPYLVLEVGVEARPWPAADAPSSPALVWRTP
ncbi:MAG: hypothetical protein R3F43_25095 [bacterium]